MFPERSQFWPVPFLTLRPAPWPAPLAEGAQRSLRHIDVSLRHYPRGSRRCSLEGLSHQQRSPLSPLLQSFLRSSCPFRPRGTVTSRHCGHLSGVHFPLRGAAYRLASCGSHTCNHKFLVHKYSLRCYYVPGLMLDPVRDTEVSGPISDFDQVRESDKLWTCNSKIFRVPF